MIVDSAYQHTDMKKVIANNEVIAVPLLRDIRGHSCCVTIVGWYITTKDRTHEYTIVSDHPEAVYKADALPDLLQCSAVYVVGYDTLLYNKIVGDQFVDANLLDYLNTGNVPDSSANTLYDFYKRRIGFADISLVIDLVKLQEYGRSQTQKLQLDECDCLPFYQQKVIPLFHTIESSGLAVDRNAYSSVFEQNGFIHNNLTFTKYNLYTSTGRPSNRFAGVNFAALSKEDSTRECFVSRYDDGVLFELDFQSYHPRILSDLTRYQIQPTENIYQHLAAFYFNTDTPTVEQVGKAKEATFWQLYGGIRKEFRHIEYFQRIQLLTDKLWELYTKQGYIQSIISKRRITNIEDPTPAKLLNYFIQLHETEHNVTLLTEVFKRLSPEIKPVLYTYDSILFDLPKSKIQELTALLHDIIPTKYPFKVKIGDNYKHIV